MFAMHRAPRAKSGTITLSLVSHGQASLCEALLRDLAALAPPDVAKLILTINVPEPAPALDAMPFPVEVIRNPRPLGFGANHNQAFARAQGEYFAVLNPDLRIAQDPFPALVAALADPDVGIAAPQVLQRDGRVADFARRLVSPWEVVRRRLGSGYEEPDPRPEWLAGMFLMLRCADYADLGGFDTRYTLYCEDADLCARARLRGLRLSVVVEAPVTHLAQRASHRSLRPLLLHVASLVKFWMSPAYHEYRRLLRKESGERGKL
jgi:GT2 family glycosyltransferase